MTFPMPEITLRHANEIITAVLDNACWWMAEARRASEAGEDTADLTAYNKKLNAEYEAWVNWSRATWPEDNSNFMLDGEPEIHGHSFKFTKGKHVWVHDGTRWNIKTKRKGTPK